MKVQGRPTLRKTTLVRGRLMTGPKRFDRIEAADEGFPDRRDRDRAQKGAEPGPVLAPLAAGRNAMPRRTLAPRRGWLFDLSWISDTPSPLMQTRLAVVAPLMLAAVLQAQEPPAGQGPTPQQQLEKLKAEKQRLQREIEFAKKRAQQASGLLSNKFRRGSKSELTPSLALPDPPSLDLARA